MGAARYQTEKNLRHENHQHFNRPRGIMATALVAAEVQNYATAATSDQSQRAVVDEQGNLRVPEDYRTAYQFLGAWAIAAEQGKGSQQLHVVYASPGTIAAYRKDGSFPDGSYWSGI
jgi:hypothetical protein